MGIRFDKDTRRATNGPMIFFSDPSAEISLGDEIRGAIESRLSFYAYRRPGDMMISFGSSEAVIEGIAVPGFVVAPFLPTLSYLTIPYKDKGNASTINSNPQLSKFPYSFPERSTTKAEHEAEVETIKKELTREGGGKVVAARVIVEKETIDPAATFSNLCRRFPDAFVFCFSTPLTGCWVGASPELLLEAHGDQLNTMALAGTRPAYIGGEWDIKNREEQQMVTDFIIKAFQTNLVNAHPGHTITKIAGPVEHICTQISARIDSGNFTDTNLNTLLRTLSPTPAVCGLPRDNALRLITTCEHFNRGCYGGFCGPYHSPADFSLYVNLRSALIERDKLCLFVGGGITSLSVADSEWEETTLKATTILDSLIN